MTAVRHWVAIIVVVSFVPAVMYWYIIHPFAGFWRRQGLRTTYAVVAVIYAVFLVIGWLLRTTLIGRDLGTNWWLVAAGGAGYVVSLVIERACRRHLTLRTLVGVPEIEGSATTLLRSGIYGRVRHPRYLGLLVGLIGVALLVNHAGFYFCVAVFHVMLYGVILMEERELRVRFGESYGDYMRNVPRLLPRPGRAARP